MLLKTILNHTHKFQSFIYTSANFIKKGSRSIIEVKIIPRKNSRGVCSRCGKKCIGYDTLRERHYEFVPLWGIKVFFLYVPRRVNCSRCGIHVEKIPWADGKHHLCNTFQLFLANWAKKLSWKTTAESFNVCWEHVFRSVKSVVEYGLKHRQLDNIETIGIDEIKYKFGHKYLTLVYQLDEGKRRLLFVGKDRKAETLLRFFVNFGKERSNNIKAVCTDMWAPYLKVIKDKIPNALNIIDRFHLKKLFNKALDEVRREESQDLKREGYEPVLEKSRWPLLKNAENLTDKQNLKLKEILQYNLKSVKSYLLKQDFEIFWKYVSPYWAGKFLDNWTYKVMRSRIKPMKKVAKSLRRYKPLIMNWFKVKGKLSSGPVEGLNNKAKVTIRKAYGFREYNVLKMALFHQLGDLPEPELTHRFC